MENTTHQQNHVFSNLWIQAESGNLGRRVDRARNGQGRRALKFKTHGFHKALILEVNHRPGFVVRLCDFVEKAGLIDSDGIVTFANPIDTEALDTLLSQIDRWASSFEIIFGEKGAAIQVITESRNDAASGRDQDVNVVQDDEHESAETESVTCEPETTDANEASTDDWDRMDVSDVGNAQE